MNSLGERVKHSMLSNKEINFFAKTDYRNKERVFGIKTDDRRRHLYVIGKTGMGKTNAIQNMAIQDIRNGKGVAIVDPHGEFAEECLKAVPTSRINDVVYFNPADTEHPIAMNIMEKVEPEYRHLVASGLVGVFKKIWADSWGPRLEYLLRNAILALLEDPSSTLLGVNRMLIDKEYRSKVIEKVSDPVVSTFWTDEFTKYHDRLLADAIAPIQNKVGQFLSSSLIRNIVGQTKSAFDIREIMDNEKILIMNLSKGRIGEDNSALLGAMMITKIQLAAMARVDMPESERKDFYLYVDEFQNFATESFKNILSEARKYKLNLILAHQYIAQLDETVRDAVFGNVGTIVTFRIGAMDSEVLEKEFEPIFYANDLVNLTKYHIYLKLMIDGVATNPFSAATIEPIDVVDTINNYDKIINVSRERYGTKKEIIEEKINRWSGMILPEVRGKISELAKNQTPASDVPKIVPPKNVTNVIDNKPRKDTTPNSVVSEQENIPQASTKETTESNVDDREIFESQCWGCDIEVQVPFKPDGVRPVFCKDCLKNYRREQAKLQTDLSQSEQNKQQVVVNQKQTRSPHESQPEERNIKPEKFEKQEVDKNAVRELISKALLERQDNDK